MHILYFWKSENVDCVWFVSRSFWYRTCLMEQFCGNKYVVMLFVWNRMVSILYSTTQRRSTASVWHWSMTVRGQFCVRVYTVGNFNLLIGIDCRFWLLLETSRWLLINAFFQVKLKWLPSELIIALKVIISFGNHFWFAGYGSDCQVNLSKTI